MSSVVKLLIPEDYELNEKDRSISLTEAGTLHVEQILGLKNTLGLKLFNEKWNGKAMAKKTQQDFKRENKNRPREMSAKRKVSKFKAVVQVKEAFMLVQCSLVTVPIST